MIALRYVYVLALAVWLGGMVVLGAVVAPTTFQVLQASAPDIGRALAGEAFGAMLARFHYLAYAAGVILLLTLTVMAHPRAAAAALCHPCCGWSTAMLAGRAVLRTSSCSARIDAIQQEVGSLPSQLPAADPRRIRFDELHALSTRLMMVNIVGAFALLFWEARE